MEVTASQFARMCGVSPMAISKRIKAGTLIKNENKKLDTDNPANRSFFEQKQNAFKTKQELRKMETEFLKNNNSDDKLSSSNTIFLTSSPQQTTKENIENSDSKSNINYSPNEMLKLPIGQLLKQFKSIDAIEKYSKILRDLSSADEREQKTQERRLSQIPKEFVLQSMFGYMNQLMNQLLDVPEAVCDQIIAVSLSGRDDCRISVMHILNDNLTRCISGAKEHMINELNALKNKYDKQERFNIEIQEQIREAQEAW